jgi:tetratricopeptide (TPR) repeat protein
MSQPARGIGIDFGAASCRAMAAEGSRYTPLADVPPLSELVWSTPPPRWAALKTSLGRPLDVRAGSAPTSAIDLVTRTLRQVRQSAAGQLRAEITGAALAVPPTFTDAQRAAMIAAGEKSGFTRAVLVNECQAAALYHSTVVPERGLWLVYAMGKSGVFSTLLDASTLRTVAVNGGAGAAGDDIDAALASELIARGAVVSRGGAESATRILRLAEACKIRLCTAESVRLGDLVPAHDTLDWLPDPNFIATGDLLERAASAAVERSLEFTRLTLREAALASSSLALVLLLGESTRLPLVRRRLGELLGSAPPYAQAPPMAVAHGAAILAATRLGDCWKPVEAGVAPTPPSAGPPPAAAPPAAESRPAELWTAVRAALDREAYDEAIPLYERMLDAAGTELSFVLNKRAQQMAISGDTEGALRLLQKAMTRSPANPVPRRQAAEIYADLAVKQFTLAGSGGRALRVEKYRRARALAQESLRLDDSNQRARQVKQQCSKVLK